MAHLSPTLRLGEIKVLNVRDPVRLALTDTWTDSVRSTVGNRSKWWER
jgi:hypothetical protein